MIKKLGNKVSRYTRGSSLVEFALLMFLLVLLIAGVADIGRALNHYIVITNAAREGARLGSRAKHTDVIDDWITEAVEREAANSGVDLTDPGVAQISIEPPIIDRQAGNPITVTVDYTVTTFFSGIIGIRDIDMRSETVMMMYDSEAVTETTP